MQKLKKTYSFRLEAKEADWLDGRSRTTKQSPSTVLRDLIRDKIGLDAALATTKPLQNKTIYDWNITKKEVQTQ